MRLVDELGNEVVVPVKYRKKVKQMMTANDQAGISLLVAQFGGTNKTGYTPGTDTYNNPYNVIPGGDITMRNTPFPVMGYPLDGNHNVGEPMLMKPGGEYNFPGASQVLEVPAHQYGTYEDPTMQNFLPPVDLPYGYPQDNILTAQPSVVAPQEAPYTTPAQRPQPIEGLAPQPPTGYGMFEPPKPKELTVDDLMTKYEGYLGTADDYNEVNFAQSKGDYNTLIDDLRGYSAAQGASSTLGTLMQNPYTQAALLDQGFADATRKSRRMPQYLLDTQRAEAESQMSRVANQLISSGARPAEVASMMAPYYQDLQRTQNQLALQRFQTNSEADKDYYSFLTELKGKNTIEEVENRNKILAAKNQIIQQHADTTTDQFRNLADLRAKDVELQRMAAKEYNDNLFRTALARLGIAGPELEYRMRERELQNNDKWREQALGMFKGNPNATVAVTTGGLTNNPNAPVGAAGPQVTVSAPVAAGPYREIMDPTALPEGFPAPTYEIPDNPTSWRSYPEDDPVYQSGAPGWPTGRGIPSTQPVPQVAPEQNPIGRSFSVTDTAKSSSTAKPKKKTTGKQWTVDDALFFLTGSGPEMQAELTRVAAHAAKNPERASKVKWLDSRGNVLWNPDRPGVYPPLDVLLQAIGSTVDSIPAANINRGFNVTDKRR